MNAPGRRCPRCASSMRMQVQAVISAPSELEHQLSKQNLRSKEVYLMGVLWETADHICTNPECGKVIDGYGNYVTKLKQENTTLRKKITDLAFLCENGPYLEVNNDWFAKQLRGILKVTP